MFMFMKSRAGCSQAPAPSLTASRALRILFFLPLPSSRIFDPPVAPLQLSTFTLSFKLILPPYLRTQHYTTSKLSSSVTALIKRQVLLASSPASSSQVWVSDQLLLPSLLARIQLAASHCRGAPSVPAVGSLLFGVCCCQHRGVSTRSRTA